MGRSIVFVQRLILLSERQDIHKIVVCMNKIRQYYCLAESINSIHIRYHVFIMYDDL